MTFFGFVTTSQRTIVQVVCVEHVYLCMDDTVYIEPMNRPRRFSLLSTRACILCNSPYSYSVRTYGIHLPSGKCALVEKGQHHLGIDVKPLHLIERTKTKAEGSIVSTY
jgi:hypothetical protein